MAHAILMLSDEADPAIKVHVSWEGEFDENSRAHQLMRRAIKELESIAPKVPDSEPLPTAVTVGRLYDNIAAAERKAIEDGSAEPMFGTREGDGAHAIPH